MLRTTGISDVEAEELAILPGMEELSAMMYVNQFRREQRYDVIVLDCAPTAESMRFVSMPTTLEWYMKHIFPVPARHSEGRAPARQPRVARSNCPPTATSPISRTCSASWTASANCWRIPRSPACAWSRIPERMVLRETQRAFVYFSLHGLTVDGVIVNRVLPARGHRRVFPGVARLAGQHAGGDRSYFAPVPVKRVPLFTHEVLGRERLEELARSLYDGKEDPAAVTRTEAPYTFTKSRRPLRGAAATAVCRQGRNRAVQEGRRTGGGDRNAAPPHRTAHVHGRPFRPAAQSWKIEY